MNKLNIQKVLKILLNFFWFLPAKLAFVESLHKHHPIVLPHQPIIPFY